MDPDTFKLSDVLQSGSGSSGGNLLEYLKQINSILEKVAMFQGKRGGVQSVQALPNRQVLVPSQVKASVQASAQKQKEASPVSPVRNDKDKIVLYKDKKHIEEYADKLFRYSDMLIKLVGDVRISELKKLYEENKEGLISMVMKFL